MTNFVTGIFNSRLGAEVAVDSLEKLNYKRTDISVLMHDQTRAKEFAEETGTSVDAGNQASKGAKIAASIGGALGAIVVTAMTKRKDAADPLTSATRGSGEVGSSSAGAARGPDDVRSSTPGVVRGSGDVGGSSSGTLRTSSDYGAASRGGVTGSSDVGSSSSGTLGTGRSDDPVDTSTLRSSATSGSSSGNIGMGTQATSTSLSSTSPGADTPTVAGPLAGVLAGAGLGGLIGALVGAGISKDVAQQYENELGRGGILIGVDARSADESRVREILNDRSGNTSPSTIRKPSTP